jgi:DNA-binding transcriptional MerR regulator
VLRRIAFIVFAQRIGLTLEEIGGELAKLPPHQAPTRRDWSRLSATWASRIDERIAELERLKLGLTECIGCAASRSTAVSSRTRATGPAHSAPARATGSATGR